MVHAALKTRTAKAGDGDVAALMDALWAHATKEDGLEHVRARAGPGCIEVIMFLHCDSAENARYCATRILATVHHTSRLFSENYSEPFTA
ncbi:hypothetical protein AB0I81_38575 [Nonomuraea sp. NPDC050404]|uniref:hypothetical protein n=1 Tax=Nonomuraea sp. NPDC050404 TaxID=3155783 RepID=UPI0033C4AE51